jgi:Saxitoxin biosynthesis operon protein SxtJ
MSPHSSHKISSPRAHDIKMGSERGFGIVFAVVFAVVGIWPALRLGWRPSFDSALVRWWSLPIGAVFLAVALVRPKILRPLNWLWFRFGMFLSRIMTPIVMGLIFILTVVPTAVIMRLRGHDPMRRKLDWHAKSYWIVREPPGPDPTTMRNQY